MSRESNYQPLDNHFSTNIIHCPHHPQDAPSMAVAPPLVLSSTFHQNDVEKHSAFLYTRFGNPNRKMIEKTLAKMDNGKYAVCFSSGMAAISMVVHLAGAGDHILSINDVYGGTHKYFTQYTESHNITVTFADLNDIEILEKNLQPTTKLVWLETLTNPLMEIVDIVSIAKRVKELNPRALVVVDNSFLTPYFVRPLDLGAHISVSSLTKYMNGHSDVMMGVIVTNDEEIYKVLSDLQQGVGAVPAPYDCYMALRGMRTLPLRMRHHMCSAYKVARFLQTHPMIEKVLYAGLPSHPKHEIAKQQWSGVSGMLSFYIRANLEDIKKFLQKLKYFYTCPSYGSFESVIEIPMFMSHKHTPREVLEKHGVTENLLRLSVGLEDVSDLINDLKQALDSVIRIHYEEDRYPSNIEMIAKTRQNL